MVPTSMPGHPPACCPGSQAEQLGECLGPGATGVPEGSRWQRGQGDLGAQSSPPQVTPSGGGGLPRCWEGLGPWASYSSNKMESLPLFFDVEGVGTRGECAGQSLVKGERGRRGLLPAPHAPPTHTGLAEARGMGHPTLQVGNSKATEEPEDAGRGGGHVVPEGGQSLH